MMRKMFRVHRSVQDGSFSAIPARQAGNPRLIRQPAPLDTEISTSNGFFGRGFMRTVCPNGVRILSVSAVQSTKSESGSPNLAVDLAACQ